MNNLVPHSFSSVVEPHYFGSLAHLRSPKNQPLLLFGTGVHCFTDLLYTIALWPACVESAPGSNPARGEQIQIYFFFYMKENSEFKYISNSNLNQLAVICMYNNCNCKYLLSIHVEQGRVQPRCVGISGRCFRTG